MNILLTGGTGYIGSHTAVVLAQAGHQVLLYDNLCNSSIDVLARLQRILGYLPWFTQGDLRDTALLTQVVQEQQIDAVVHFAGLKAVGESVAQPISYYDNNVAGTLSLLRAMQAAGVKMLVFSSSATVYGDPAYLPIDEQHPTIATNPYGRSKLHIEHMLADLAHSDPAWRIACLRYFNPVGAHPSGQIGEDPNGTPNNLMPFIARVAAGKLSQLSVFGGDYPTLDGTGVRDYIHVMDLAEGHARALKFLWSNPGVRVWNLGSGRGYSVLEVVRAFEEASGKEVPYRIDGRRAGDVAACYADPSRAGRELGWEAERKLQEMVRDAWNWQSMGGG